MGLWETLANCKVLGAQLKESALLDVAGMCGRLKIFEAFPEEFKMMRGRLDNVVMRHMSKMNSAGVSEVNLLIGHRHHCCCFMQPTDIDEFLEANGNFERVKAQIDRLRQSSFTGEFLFEFASKLVASSTMRYGLIAAVDKIAEEHVFSESSIK